jgi:hypothetical protein
MNKQEPLLTASINKPKRKHKQTEGYAKEIPTNAAGVLLLNNLFKSRHSATSVSYSTLFYVQLSAADQGIFAFSLAIPDLIIMNLI